MKERITDSQPPLPPGEPLPKQPRVDDDMEVEGQVAEEFGAIPQELMKKISSSTMFLHRAVERLAASKRNIQKLDTELAKFTTHEHIPGIHPLNPPMGLEFEDKVGATQVVITLTEKTARLQAIQMIYSPYLHTVRSIENQAQDDRLKKALHESSLAYYKSRCRLPGTERIAAIKKLGLDLPPDLFPELQADHSFHKKA
eukprot:NODE_13849_length_1143_cov_4.416339.p1 GENE.NODE_13849_length_1143_cov_4.416339~~NODE_13849_length_1143_cov_4.416339.p1  ORF type:complete len:199 (+),score=30.94 NODE_13849_length_1143_cov_4.416339:380-976(+)